jgi:WD40 repeat protein
VQIWAPDSAEPKYTLSGHEGNVTCLQFFTRDDQQYLITGSNDCTAKVYISYTFKHLNRNVYYFSEHDLDACSVFCESDMGYAEKDVCSYNERFHV